MDTARRSLLPILLGLVAAGLLWAGTSLYGVGMTTVSGDYVSAARSLCAHGTFVQHDGSTFIDYPPFYTMALASFGAFGMDPQDAARWFNTICLGLLVFVAARWLQRSLRSSAIAVLGALALVVSLPVLTMSVSAFPEVLFMLLVLLTVWSAARYARTGTRGAYVATVVWAALSCLTRYMGVTVVAVAAVVILVREAPGIAARLRRAVAFGVLALLPTVLWSVRNAMITGSFAGRRGASDFSLPENVRLMWHVVSMWVLPERIPEPLRVAAVIVFVVCVLAWVLTHRREERDEVRGDTAAMTLFAVVYVVATVVALSIVALDRMNTRYLIPAYVPFLLVTMAALDGAARQFRTGTLARVASIAVVGGLCAWVLLGTHYTRRNVMEMRTRGAGGYSTRAWHRSATVASLRENPPEGLVYSNDAYAVHILTGIPARPSPRRHRFNSTTSTTRDLEHFRATVDSAGAVSLVWFDPVHRDYLYSVPDLAQAFHLDVADSTTDGCIYHVRP